MAECRLEVEIEGLDLVVTIVRLRAELDEVASFLTEGACDHVWFERRPCRFCSRSLVCVQCAVCCGCYEEER